MVFPSLWPTKLIIIDQGYCSRGALCKFSHGDDAVVPGQLYPMGNMPFPMLPMLTNMFGMANGSSSPYDPHQSHMDVDSGRNGMSGELPVVQDLTPNVRMQDVNPHPSQHTGIPQNETDSNSGAELHGTSNGISSAQPAIDMNAPGASSSSVRGSGFRGRGRGTFNHREAPGFNPGQRQDKTLVVEKIPEEKLTLGHVNDWFKRFGTVTNVAIDKAGAKALVSLSTHEEARAAWKSEDAVFGNRFVKIFWHRPMEGHGQVGTRALAASSGVVSALATKDNAPTPGPPPKPVQPIPRKQTTSSAANALAAKHQLLEKQIAEQKSLMSSLSSASGEEKKTIMARLRKLNEEMSASSSAATDEVPSKTSEQKGMEELDKELDKHNVTGAIEGEETTEALQAKLEQLKAEVMLHALL
jgi:RNA-binding protein 26